MKGLGTTQQVVVEDTRHKEDEKKKMQLQEKQKRTRKINETRKKMLDAIGDLYLLGHNLVGSFEGYKSGHKVNNALLRELVTRPETWEILSFDDPSKSPITYLDPIIDPSSG